MHRTEFRYFGDNGTDDWKEHAPHLKRIIEQLGQVHRVNHTCALPRRPKTHRPRLEKGSPPHKRQTTACDSRLTRERIEKQTEENRGVSTVEISTMNN